MTSVRTLCAAALVFATLGTWLLFKASIGLNWSLVSLLSALGLGLFLRLAGHRPSPAVGALLAGVASGIGHAFTQSSTTLSVSPLGTTSSVDPGKQLEAGLGTGVGKALDRLAQYYISLAEKVFPVIEVDAGRSVDVVLTQGVALPGTLDAAGTDPDNLAQLAERARTLRRNDDEDD